MLWGVGSKGKGQNKSSKSNQYSAHGRQQEERRRQKVNEQDTKKGAVYKHLGEIEECKAGYVWLRQVSLCLPQGKNVDGGTNQ